MESRTQVLPDAASDDLAQAWHMVKRADIQPGEYVMVWGALSGPGAFAVKLCRLLNAQVLAVVESGDQVEQAVQLGAHAAVAENPRKVFQEVRRFTNKKGVQVVLAPKGTEQWESSIQCVAYAARIVTHSGTGDSEVPLDLRFLFWKQLSILGCHFPTETERLEAFALASRF